MKKAVILFAGSLFALYILLGGLQFTGDAAEKIKTTSHQLKNFEILVLSELVYCDISSIHIKKSTTLKELLYSKNASYINATTKVKSELLEDGFTLKQIVQKARLNQWHIYKYEKNEENGFYGIIFTNTHTHEFVVSFQGTNSFKDLYEDYKLVTTNKENLQVETAETLLAALPKEIDPKHVTLTGHSLGGYLAAWLGASTNYKAVVFNAFGFVPRYLQTLRSQGIMKHEENVTNYCIDGDFVSEFGEHIGKVVTFPKKWYWIFPLTHDINIFYNYIQA